MTAGFAMLPTLSVGTIISSAAARDAVAKAYREAETALRTPIDEMTPDHYWRPEEAVTRHYCINCDGFQTPTHDCQPAPLKIYRPQTYVKVANIPASPAINWKRHKLFQAMVAEIVRFLPLVGEHIASALLWMQVERIENRLSADARA